MWLFSNTWSHWGHPYLVRFQNGRLQIETWNQKVFVKRRLVHWNLQMNNLHQLHHNVLSKLIARLIQGQRHEHGPQLHQVGQVGARLNSQRLKTKISIFSGSRFDRQVQRAKL